MQSLAQPFGFHPSSEVGSGPNTEPSSPPSHAFGRSGGTGALGTALSEARRWHCRAHTTNSTQRRRGHSDRLAARRVADQSDHQADEVDPLPRLAACVDLSMGLLLVLAAPTAGDRQVSFVYTDNGRGVHRIPTRSPAPCARPPATPGTSPRRRRTCPSRSSAPACGSSQGLRPCGRLRPRAAGWTRPRCVRRGCGGHAGGLSWTPAAPRPPRRSRGSNIAPGQSEVEDRREVVGGVREVTAIAAGLAAQVDVVAHRTASRARSSRTGFAWLGTQSQQSAR